MSKSVVPVANAYLKDFLRDVLGTALVYCEHDGRKTVTCMDVVCSLKRHHKTLYGFD